MTHHQLTPAARRVYRMFTTEPCEVLCDFDYAAFLKHVNHARRKARRNRRKKAAA